MELQTQIYLIISIFASTSVLLFVLILTVTIYMMNVKKLVMKRSSRQDVYEEDDRGKRYHNSLEHSMGRMDPRMDIGRPGFRSNLSGGKPRNEDVPRGSHMHRREQAELNGRRADARHRSTDKLGGPDSVQEYPMSYDNEINSMFDMDDLEMDEGDSGSEHGTVPSGHSRTHVAQSKQQLPPHNQRVHNQGNNGRFKNQSMGSNVGGGAGVGNAGASSSGTGPIRGGGPYSDAFYDSSNQHESKTYFNERGLNY